MFETILSTVRLTSLLVCLLLSGKNAIAQSGGETNNQDIINFFEQQCLDPLQDYVGSNVEDLYRFTQEETDQLTQSLNIQGKEWKVWSPKGGSHVLILKDANTPLPCTVANFKVEAEDMRVVWETLASAQGFRSESGTNWPVAKSEEKVIRLSWDGLKHVIGSDFLLVSARFLGPRDEAIVVLTGMRLEKSNFTCAFFPENC